jgi:hypothetical protein
LIELADNNFTSREGATLVTIKRCDFWFAQYRGELGLNVSVANFLEHVPEIESLARRLAGFDADAEVFELARRVSEAQIDLNRVRAIRRRLIISRFADPPFVPAQKQKISKHEADIQRQIDILGGRPLIRGPVTAGRPSALEGDDKGETRFARREPSLEGSSGRCSISRSPDWRAGGGRLSRERSSTHWNVLEFRILYFVDPPTHRRAKSFPVSVNLPQDVVAARLRACKQAIDAFERIDDFRERLGHDFVHRKRLIPLTQVPLYVVSEGRRRFGARSGGARTHVGGVPERISRRRRAAPRFFLHDAGRTGLFVPCAAGDALWP